MTQYDGERVSALLDGEVNAGELDSLLAAVPHGRHLRDTISTYQLVNDAIAGHVGLDHGYTQRILKVMEQRGILKPATGDARG
jgi:negative regulator of sigma E activity